MRVTPVKLHDLRVVTHDERFEQYGVAGQEGLFNTKRGRIGRRVNARPAFGGSKANPGRPTPFVFPLGSLSYGGHDGGGAAATAVNL